MPFVKVLTYLYLIWKCHHGLTLAFLNTLFYSCKAPGAVDTFDCLFFKNISFFIHFKIVSFCCFGFFFDTSHHLLMYVLVESTSIPWRCQ